MNALRQKKAIAMHNYSYQNLNYKDNGSSCLSGLSNRDEWTEIQVSPSPNIA
jgi:hypothetical protein